MVRTGPDRIAPYRGMISRNLSDYAGRDRSRRWPPPPGASIWMSVSRRIAPGRVLGAFERMAQVAFNGAQSPLSTAEQIGTSVSGNLCPLNGCTG
jgi:hypothetical protein